MDLRPLLTLGANQLEFAHRPTERLDVVMPPSFAPVALAATCQARPGRLTVAVTASGRDADELEGALRAFGMDENVEVFPAWETLPHERLSPRSDTVARRLKALRRLVHPEEFPSPLDLLIVPVRAFLQPIATGLGDLEAVRVRVGESIDVDVLEAQLVAAAYSRVDMIEKRGEFAVRGGIIDIFPPNDRHPSRIELFGDEVEEIRTFQVADQRSIEEVQQVYAPPCREIPLTQAVRARARSLMTSLPGAVEMLDQIAEGIAPEGMESLAPVLVDGLVPFASYFPAEAGIVVVEPERATQRAQMLFATTEEFLQAAWSSAAAGGPVPLEVGEASFLTLEDQQAEAVKQGHSWWTFAGFSTEFSADELAESARDSAELINLNVSEVENFAGSTGAAIDSLRGLGEQGYHLVLVVEGAGLGRRLAGSLIEAELPARFVDDLPQALDPGVCYVTAAPIAGGFVLPGEKCAVYTGADLLGRRASSTRDMRKMPSRRKESVDPLSLKPGDYVVHSRHGVGRFVRLDHRTVGTNNERIEYVVIEYQSPKRGLPADELWLRADSLEQLTKYAGGQAPKLNKLGGADWAKTKAKARAATRKIAAELIRLYAQRQSQPGFAFSPDTPWQRELEEAFAYVETPDQLHTIEEVKADMEKPVPMDRLISGDVGYGKTEIAVRAAFKAVQDSKQVAVLVPTTLLVSQHYATFTERYTGFPVKVASLSRFQTEAEAKQVIAGLADGSVDVVIGTHRLLTGNVRFKDLGLVIIDEEQRFGVEHKETLKQMYPAVDVLSMSATPIPRTLEMAVTGVRELSTLATPPEERHPVLTYVGKREDKQILAAIKRELLRDGQVFYVHNRVGDMDRVAKHLADLVPDARIATAHGKMNEHQLESVIQQFWNKEIDVLVCTTIVETGLDISNANTLIVENAEKFGLSQLHQLRGRVGRGRERAYAYFLYEGGKVMTQTALERLRTIAANTDLGAGMQVALKDLEIRGAGNMLGGEQSGQIEGVGFDLYVRMVSEAVEKFKGGDLFGEDEEEHREVRIDLPVEALLPEEYIPSPRLRLEAYQKVSATHDEAGRESVRSELRDRYGVLPKEAERLLDLAAMREFCEEVGLDTVLIRNEKELVISPALLSDSRHARMRRLYRGSREHAALRQVIIPLPDTTRKLGATTHLENDEAYAWVFDVLHTLFDPPAPAPAE